MTQVGTWYHTIERTGRVREKPFEGMANDIPVSTIAGCAEIDLREMPDEKKSIFRSSLLKSTMQRRNWR